VWQYIAQERLADPPIYFSHRREVLPRNGVLLAASPYVTPVNGEQVSTRTVRCRTVGDMTCTGCVESHAASVEDVIKEIAAARVSERGSRADDRRSENAMEDRKAEGYF
jgi:sulfate adenylyltransferase subunit 2